MNVLVLGGTRFLGRHIVARLLADGHGVTVFNRGRTNPDLFPGADVRRGDRDGGLDALGDGRWDAVVDTCGYVPRVVAASAAALRGRVDRYVFVSSISVYADPPGDPADGPDEAAPVATLADPTTEVVDGATYGALKARCEDEVRARFGDAALVIRPGIIVGPHDPTDRFTYWPARVDRGGPFVAPEGPAATFQAIDVRDLADWTVAATATGLGGTYNAVGPAAGATFGALFDACAAAAGRPAEPVWVAPDRLAALGVAPWSDLPLWLPPDGRWLMRTRIDRALRHGLTFRPLAATVADTLAWHRSRDASAPLAAGLAPQREAELLASLG